MDCDVLEWYLNGRPFCISVAPLLAVLDMIVLIQSVVPSRAKPVQQFSCLD